MKRCEFTLVAFKACFPPAPVCRIIAQRETLALASLAPPGSLTGLREERVQRVQLDSQLPSLIHISIYISLIDITSISHSEANPKKN